MDRLLGAYRLHSLLGKGGFGEVWKARDETLDREVAVKLLTLDDPDDIRRFMREAQTAAALDHPNIAKVYDIGVDSGRHFIAMELIDGTSPKGPLPPREAARIVRDAARAVAHAHAQRIIHRDLKPSNLLVSGDRVFVMDFGLARSTRAASSLTASGMLVGTPAYMSPEQARGERASAASDIYSLGATLHELVAGSPPFAGDSIIEILTHVVSEEPPPLPGDVGVVVARCLAKDARHRYASAAGLADELDRVFRGAPIETKRPSRLRHLMRRRPAAIGLMLAALALLLAAVVLERTRRRESQVQRRAEVQRLEEAIARARPAFYTPGIDIGVTLEAVNRAIVDLERLKPKHATDWTTLGIGRAFTGEDARAEEAFAEALRLDPDDARAHYHLGRLLMERALLSMLRPRGRPTSDYARLSARAADHLDRATAHWERAPELDRQLARAWQTLARAGGPGTTRLIDEGLHRFGDAMGIEEFWCLRGLLSRDSRKSVEWLTRAIRIRPHYALALLARAMKHRENNDSAKAEEDASAALRLNPHMRLAWLLRALARVELHDLAGALADADEAVRRWPSDADAYASRANVRMEANDLDGADADLERSLAIEPSCVLANLVRGDVRLVRRDPRGAVAAFNDAIAREPESAEAMLSRAWARSQFGEFDEARADLDAAIRLRPDYALAYVYRGDLRHQRGDAAGGFEDLETGLRLDPKLPAARIYRGTAHMREGRLDEAIADLDAGLRLEPLNRVGLVNRSAVRFSRGDARGAVEDATEAIRIDPREAFAWSNRGTAWMSLGEPQKALADFTESIRLGPTNATARIDRGKVHRVLGNQRAAIADFDEALRLEPGSLEARFLRGNARRDAGDTREAMSDYDAVIAARPDDANARGSRGMLRLRLGNARGAVEDLDVALRGGGLDPAGLLANRGFARRALGEVAGAVADLEAALMAAPADWPARAQVERELAKLRARK